MRKKARKTSQLNRLIQSSEVTTSEEHIAFFPIDTKRLKKKEKEVQYNLKRRLVSLCRLFFFCKKADYRRSETRLKHTER